MANKQVCGKCIGNALKFLERQWSCCCWVNDKSGYKHIKLIFIDEESPVPEYCPYKLEHVLC